MYWLRGNGMGFHRLDRLVRRHLMPWFRASSGNFERPEYAPRISNGSQGCEVILGTRHTHAAGERVGASLSHKDLIQLWASPRDWKPPSMKSSSLKTIGHTTSPWLVGCLAIRSKLGGDLDSGKDARGSECQTPHYPPYTEGPNKTNKNVFLACFLVSLIGLTRLFRRWSLRSLGLQLFSLRSCVL